MSIHLLFLSQRTSVPQQSDRTAGHNAEYMGSIALCVYTSPSRNTTSINSFKSKLLQLHWQWGMDLIATEQLCQQSKNHNVKSFFFLLISGSPVYSSGRDIGEIGKYQCQHSIQFIFSVTYDCPLTVKLHTVATILGTCASTESAHWSCP